MTPYKVLSLFAGIGGFDLGLERTGGFQTVAFCEIDPFCTSVLAKHWPNVPCFGDVRSVSVERLTKQHISIDVICGGFPCQDLSALNRGNNGLEGKRSGLWFEYLRIVEEVRPAYVIIENVPDLRSRGLDTMLCGLSKIGYDAEWHCIPASAVGAPHSRDRLYVVSYPPRFGLERRTGPILQTLCRGEQAGRVDYVREIERLAQRGLVRSADDISGWVDQIKSLGNAVLPDIAERIGYAIISDRLSSGYVEFEDGEP